VPAGSAAQPSVGVSVAGGAVRFVSTWIGGSAVAAGVGAHSARGRNPGRNPTGDARVRARRWSLRTRVRRGRRGRTTARQLPATRTRADRAARASRAPRVVHARRAARRRSGHARSKRQNIIYDLHLEPRFGRMRDKRINNILAVLSKPMKYAVDCEVIDKSPRIGMFKCERPEIVAWDFEQYARLLASAKVEGEEWYAAICLAGEGRRHDRQNDHGEPPDQEQPDHDVQGPRPADDPDDVEAPRRAQADERHPRRLGRAEPRRLGEVRRPGGQGDPADLPPRRVAGPAVPHAAPQPRNPRCTSA